MQFRLLPKSPNPIASRLHILSVSRKPCEKSFYFTKKNKRNKNQKYKTFLQMSMCRIKENIRLKGLYDKIDFCALIKANETKWVTSQDITKWVLSSESRARLINWSARPMKTWMVFLISLASREDSQWLVLLNASLPSWWRKMESNLKNKNIFRIFSDESISWVRANVERRT